MTHPPAPPAAAVHCWRPQHCGRPDATSESSREREKAPSAKAVLAAELQDGLQCLIGGADSSPQLLCTLCRYLQSAGEGQGDRQGAASEGELHMRQTCAAAVRLVGVLIGAKCRGLALASLHGSEVDADEGDRSMPATESSLLRPVPCFGLSVP